MLVEAFGARTRVAQNSIRRTVFAFSARRGDCLSRSRREGPIVIIRFNCARELFGRDTSENTVETCQTAPTLSGENNRFASRAPTPER